MKKITLSLLGAIALLSCGNETGNSDTQITLNNTIDSVSYAVGINTANGMSQQFSEVNNDAFIQGFKDALDSNEMIIATEETQGIIQTYFQKKQMEDMAKKQKEQEAMYADVKSQGEQFLADNKTKDGVITTPSGLQYIVIKEGTGKKPVATSNVTVHYHGTTPDGTVFDSSVERKEPATFVLNQVIKGWTEGLQLMKEGAKYKFFIPQELAYGANPRPGGPIKPFMPLVFEVELIKINN